MTPTDEPHSIARRLKALATPATGFPFTLQSAQPALTVIRYPARVLSLRC